MQTRQCSISRYRGMSSSSLEEAYHLANLIRITMLSHHRRVNVSHSSNACCRLGPYPLFVTSIKELAIDLNCTFVCSV